MGNQYRNRGFAARWTNEYLGLNYAPLSVPGDTYTSQIVANATKYRQQLLTLANPTCIISDMATNDLAAGTGLGSIVPNALTMNAAWSSAAGGAPVIMSTTIPRTTTTDSGATTANQTAIAGFGASASNRGVWNNHVRGCPASIGAKAFIDPCLVIENSYIGGVQATETSIWIADGVTANKYSADMTHPNSYGHAYIAAGLPSRLPI